jgi:PAS domain S-box-containing protein
MVLKNLINNEDSFNKTFYSIINNNDYAIFEDKNNISIFCDIILTSNYDNLFILNKRFPASLILFINENNYANTYKNVYYIFPDISRVDLSYQLNNILNLAQTIKESYFRKTIIQLKTQNNIKNISKLLEKIGFYLKTINITDTNKNLNNPFNDIIFNKKDGIIYNDNVLFGFFLKKDELVYLFESKWHIKSNLSKYLIEELFDGLKKSEYFKTHNKINNHNNYEIKNDIEAKERFLADHIGEGLFIIDLTGKITFNNNIFAKMFDLKKNTIIGKNITEIIPIFDKDHIIVNWGKNNIEPQKIDIKSVGNNKITKYYSITYSPIFNKGKIINTCGIIRDITLQKTLENNIHLSRLETENLNKKLLNIQNAIILGFSKLSEYKDKETGGHLERIQNYVKILSQKLFIDQLFVDYQTKRNYITEEYIEEITLSSLLHDIGKVSIPDNILLKPGRLNDEEYQYMQQHAKIGGDALTYLHDIVGEQSFLTIAKEIAYYHHEKWNGKGYPFYLKQEQIPLSARIVSLCDVYDALTTKRPYKAAYSHERSCEIIYDLAGTQFDPIIISIFSSIESEFKAIRKKFAE